MLRTNIKQEAEGQGAGGQGGWENCGTKFPGVYLRCVVRQEISDMKYFFQVVSARIVAYHLLCTLSQMSKDSRVMQLIS